MNKKDCQHTNLDNECLIESQFAGMDVKCSDVMVCPEPDSIAPKGSGVGFKDHGTINFGKYQGDRWDSVPIDYLDWLAYKSTMGLEIRRKAAEVLRMVRSL